MDTVTFFIVLLDLGRRIIETRQVVEDMFLFTDHKGANQVHSNKLSNVLVPFRDWLQFYFIFMPQTNLAPLAFQFYAIRTRYVIKCTY